jgi:RimJ/RimL family protein N-acetyltransferase
MTESGATPIAVRIRDVEDSDLELFFEHQRDPEAVRMAAFAARDRTAFMAHWAKIRADETTVLQTVVASDRVVGNVVSWEESGIRAVGYWIDRHVWGRGIATKALALFLDRVTSRPLYGYVAVSNAGSIRVLEKCGFRQVTANDAQHFTTDARKADDDVEEVVLVLE